MCEYKRVIGKAVILVVMFLLSFSLSHSAAMTEGNVIPIVNLDAYGTFSAADTGSDVWGGTVSGSASPIIKFNDNFYLIPLYDGAYERQKFFTQVEEGSRAYTEIQHHDLSLTAKSILTDRAILSPYIFGGWDFNAETSDEDWGDGLYDYGEFGSGVDFDYLAYDAPNGQVLLRNGFRWYLRSYPNYKALIALASVTAPEENEKDFNAFEFNTGWRYSGLGAFSLDCKYAFLMKFFTDKKVIDADGILEGNERNEYRNTLRLETAYRPGPEGGFQYSCMAEGVYNASNQNFYDSRGTVVLTDDVFTPDYFDYMSFEACPKVSYTVKNGDRTAAVISGSYDFLMRYYTDRKTQDTGGAYTQDEQHDYQHVFAATLEIPIDENLSWITGYDYTIADSNMDYEQYYEYSYKMHRVLSGVSISY